ncbi:MAG: PorT family protein [Bacteroidales bacterium]|nr:PorT family protein [Bacteroidales bacterium]
MKIPAFTIVILFTITGYCFCQTKRDSEGYIGTIQGISFSQMDFGKKTKQEIFPGYSGGIMFVYTSAPGIGILLELNYTQKGWKIDPDSSERYYRRLNYFEVPFMTHIIIGKSKSKLVINLGPYGSCLNTEEEKTNIPDDSLDYVGYPANRIFDFGYCLGIGYEYCTKIGYFGIEARYYNSLTGIFIPSSEIQYFSSRNQVLTIGIKYSVRIFK